MQENLGHVVGAKPREHGEYTISICVLQEVYRFFTQQTCKEHTLCIEYPFCDALYY